MFEMCKYAKRQEDELKPILCKKKKIKIWRFAADKNFAKSQNDLKCMKECNQYVNILQHRIEIRTG